MSIPKEDEAEGDKSAKDEVMIYGKPIKSLSVPKLKMELAMCGLPRQGRKRELVERLENHSTANHLKKKSKVTEPEKPDVK